ncbi:MAG: class I SAM-dependent methyltransferase [Nocardiaceae bacterium]|nr:class I SAM-dependent methyltransferase [Nocardiaceae bacterium]
MSFESVRAAYGARASEYIEVVGHIDHVAAADLALVESWARRVQGQVLDVGCGPGQWTHFLTCLGVEAEGVDPVPEFIESARTTYPREHYRLARAEQ